MLQKLILSEVMLLLLDCKARVTTFHLPRCINLQGRLVPGASDPRASAHWLCTDQPVHRAKLFMHCTLSLATPAAM